MDRMRHNADVAHFALGRMLDGPTRRRHVDPLVRFDAALAAWGGTRDFDPDAVRLAVFRSLLVHYGVAAA
jgi:hypothetical protein